MTEQTKQRLKDTLIEHKNVAASEYDDEDAFVGIYFSDLVDIIDNIMHNTGWQQIRIDAAVKLTYALSEKMLGAGYSEKQIVKQVVKLADALVAELKKGEQDENN